MPSRSYSTLHTFTAPEVRPDDFAIFGQILPFPQSGLSWLFAGMLLLLVVGLLYRRLSPSVARIFLWAAVATTYAGIFVLSARWLDDVFINLIHPYNLFHHGRFSARIDSMANGTVEILYYALLTPFAGDRATLVRADYALGALLGAGHLIALHHLLRRMSLLPRFFVLAAFAAWIPIVQLFSCGYGNSAVTLLWLLGVIAVVEDKRARLATFCALMPLFRPDALLYSASLAAMYVFLHRRFALRYWIPTLLAPALYALLVHQMYHQWVPTPVLFKRVQIGEILAGLPVATPYLVSTYLFGSLERCLLLGFGMVYLFLPVRRECGLSPRVLKALLVSTLPILLFFFTTGLLGYNPANYRYYAIFDIALFLAGILGLLSILYRLAPYKAAARHPYLQLAAGFLPALFVTVVFLNISSSIALVEGGTWEGKDVGISTTYYDLKRMADLRFGGEHFGKIMPRGWEVASTEMDTFGYFSGLETLDLWGFSNLRIAQSSDKTSHFRRDTHLLMDSDVPVFWVRTMSNNSPEYALHELLEASDAATFEKGLFQFPNLTDEFGQAGHLSDTLQKYDVVRVLHGSNTISLLLVRKDLATQFHDAMVRGGAIPTGTMRLPLAQ